VVLGRDNEVLHAGRLGEPGKLRGVKPDRVQTVGHFTIIRHRDIEALHDPLGFVAGVYPVALPLSGEEGIRSPVDEHAELVVAEPRHAVVVGRSEAGGMGCGERQGEEHGGETRAV
jgi:hypothetical protein